MAAAGEDTKGGSGANSTGSGYSPPQDDSLSLLPLAAELGLSVEERPDPRKYDCLPTSFNVFLVI